MFEEIIKAILLSIVVASISFFVSHSQLFEGQRKWLWDHNIKFFAQLVSCCYCLAHWYAAAFIFLFPVRLFGIYEGLDYVLTWLVISWLAGLQSLAASRLWGE